jgi:hypothetical protein
MAGHFVDLIESQAGRSHCDNHHKISSYYFGQNRGDLGRQGHRMLHDEGMRRLEVGYLVRAGVNSAGSAAASPYRSGGRMLKSAEGLY